MQQRDYDVYRSPQHDPEINNDDAAKLNNPAKESPATRHI